MLLPQGRQVIREMIPLLRKLSAHVRLFLISFIDKDLTFYAASLSFYTIFTIIPLFLIMMSILTALPSFGDIYAKIQDFMFSNLMPVQSDIVMEQINGFLLNSSQMGIMS